MHFDPNKLPKTINAGSFKAIVVRAHGYRTQIHDSESDEFVDNLWKEVGDEYVKVKSNITGHEELTSHIRIM